MTARSRFGLLAEKPYRLVWIGRSASVVGDSLMPVAMVFAILGEGGSATQIGAVLGASMAVRALLLVIGGALADRLPRRVMLAGSDVGLAAVQAVIGTLLLTGHGSVWLILLGGVLGAAGAAVARPAMTGLVPDLVSTAQLQQANALMGMSRSAAQVAGPALAGLLIATVGPGWTYQFDALTFVVSAVCLMAAPIAARRAGGGGSLLGDIVDGWRELLARRWYLVTLLCHAVWNLGSSAFFVLGPVILVAHGGGAPSWGLVTASLAVGSLLGGIVAYRWRPRRPLVVGHAALLLTALQLLALLQPSPVLVIAACAVAGGMGTTFINEIWTTAIQQFMPPAVISRMSSYDWLVSFVVTPAGYAAVGPLADSLGTTGALGTAIALVVSPVVVLLSLPWIRRVRQTPDGRMTGVDAEQAPARPGDGHHERAVPEQSPGPDHHATAHASNTPGDGRHWT